MITRLFFIAGAFLMMSQQASAECCYADENCRINTVWDPVEGKCVFCPCGDTLHHSAEPWVTQK